MKGNINGTGAVSSAALLAFEALFLTATCVATVVSAAWLFSLGMAWQPLTVGTGGALLAVLEAVCWF